jgi:hypothetical protein
MSGQAAKIARWLMPRREAAAYPGLLRLGKLYLGVGWRHG